MKSKLIRLAVILYGFLVYGAGLASAQTTGIRPRFFNWYRSYITVGDFYEMLGRFSNFLVTVSAVLVGITLMWSGVAYTTAGADPTKATKAKTIFKNGLIAGLIIFAVGVVLNTIEEFAKDPVNFFY